MRLGKDGRLTMDRWELCKLRRACLACELATKGEHPDGVNSWTQLSDRLYEIIEQYDILTGRKEDAQHEH